MRAPRSLVAALLCIASAQLAAQDTMRPPSPKSPTLAAALSFFVFPGVGSFYAGNTGHGTRHVVIGGVSMTGAVILALTCEDDGFCDFDHDAARLTTVGVLVAAYIGNSVWSILAALSDAEDFNRRLPVARLELRPGIRPLSHDRVGVDLLRFRF